MDELLTPIPIDGFYLGNGVSILSSDDYTTNSSKILGTTRCVFDAKSTVLLVDYTLSENVFVGTTEFLVTGTSLLTPEQDLKSVRVVIPETGYSSEISGTSEDGKTLTARFSVPSEYATQTIHLNVVGVDVLGNKSNIVSKETTVLNEGIKTPEFIIPEDEKVYEDMDVQIEVAPFETINGEDTHSRTDYKITSDPFGKEIIVEELDSEQLTSFTFPNPSLKGDTTYYLWARQKGEKYGYSVWVKRPLFVHRCVVNAPVITSPESGATIGRMNVTITTGKFSVTGGTDTHASSDWKITSDEAGTTVIHEAMDSTLVTHVFTNTALEKGSSYYLWVRHKGTKYGESDWSKVKVKILNARHGDILYDTSGKPAAVLIGSYHSNGAEPWTIHGKKVWLAVALASRRSAERGIPWTAVAGNGDFYDTPGLSSTYVNGKLSNSLTGVDGMGNIVSINSLETNMDISITTTPKTSKGATDAIVKVRPSYKAVSFCRSVVLKDFGAMDLPIMESVFRVYQSRKIIDELDPTVSTYPRRALSEYVGDRGWAYIHSSSEFSNSESWANSDTGYHSVIKKDEKRFVVPVKEIEE